MAQIARLPKIGILNLEFECFARLGSIWHKKSKCKLASFVIPRSAGILVQKLDWPECQIGARLLWLGQIKAQPPLKSVVCGCMCQTQVFSPEGRPNTLQKTKTHNRIRVRCQLTTPSYTVYTKNIKPVILKHSGPLTVQNEAIIQSMPYKA